MVSSIFYSSPASVWKTFAVSVLIIIIIILVNFSFMNQPSSTRSDFFHVTTSHLPPNTTNISHLVFGILGTTEAWHHRKSYIESWWRPNITRGYLYLDTDPTNDLLPWSPYSPPFRISDNNTKLLEETKHVSPRVVRMGHAMIEVFREEREGVRWYIMGDDDSIFFVDNLVDELSKYDHTKYIYIGTHSENIVSNQAYSYDSAFGGAGLIFSYPLAKIVQQNIEGCFRRYPYLKSSDLTMMNCVNDLGVSKTNHQGLHQMDLRGDASGFLSAQRKVPLLSLHHFDFIDPIFPSMDRFESARHLMKAANVDQPRLVQQTICYNRNLSWSFSVSWGYSVHIYETVIPRTILKMPIETFSPWVGKEDNNMFNTRRLLNHSCETPHVYSFESIKTVYESEVITNYARIASRGLPTCSLANSHSADFVSRIEVVSPTRKPYENGKTECCDVAEIDGMGVAKLKFRDCMDDELIA